MQRSSVSTFPRAQSFVFVNSLVGAPKHLSMRWARIEHKQVTFCSTVIRYCSCLRVYFNALQSIWSKLSIWSWQLNQLQLHGDDIQIQRVQSPVCFTMTVCRCFLICFTHSSTYVTRTLLDQIVRRFGWQDTWTGKRFGKRVWQDIWLRQTCELARDLAWQGTHK